MKDLAESQSRVGDTVSAPGVKLYQHPDRRFSSRTPRSVLPHAPWG
jgi:hypothetical protein